MLHRADDGIDHDLEARADDGLVARVGDGRVGDCESRRQFGRVEGEEKREMKKKRGGGGGNKKRRRGNRNKKRGWVGNQNLSPIPKSCIPTVALPPFSLIW